MSKWSNYYAGRVGKSYSNFCEKKYLPFISEILSWGKLFREEGCGIGTISKLLSIHHISPELMDYDNDILSLARWNTNLEKIYRGDIRTHDSKRVDVIFSHGVLEHFSYEDMGRIIQRQKSLATKVIHYVPTSEYKTKSFGDGVLRGTEWWQTKFNPIKFIPFNEGKDLILVW
jgi:hypothetical protein